MEKLGFAAGVCVCGLCVVSASTFESADMGIGETHDAFVNYQMKPSPTTSFHPAQHLAHSLSTSPGFLGAAVHGAESFTTHFVCVSFPGLPAPIPALQKQCIQFVSTKRAGTWQRSSKGWSLSFKMFQKAAGNTACSQQQWGLMHFFFLHVSACAYGMFHHSKACVTLLLTRWLGWMKAPFVRALMYSIWSVQVASFPL